MTTLTSHPDLPEPIIARPALSGDEAALRRLWQLFRHDMSAYGRDLPGADGSYRSERLELALADPAWDAWLLTAAEHPIGFALTRAMDQPVRVLNSFFLVVPARRRGLGLAFADAVLSATPGTWEVAYQDANAAAASFWPAVAARFGEQWVREHRPVPGRPELPPDTWVTFTTGGESTTELNESHGGEPPPARSTER